MKRLIINADDLGMTPGINRAIARCHSEGVVSSSTLMANSAAFGEAVAYAKQTPTLGVGCHVVLLDGEPLSSRETIPSLLKPSGAPYVTIGEFAPRALRGHFHENEIESEASAQLAKIRAAGLEPTHIDAHKHAQMFPAVLRPLLRAAKTAGVRAIRNPFEAAGVLPFSAKIRPLKMAIRSTEVAVLRLMRKSFMREVEQAGLKTTRGCIGVAATGSMTIELFEQMMARLPEGDWELCTHPGYNDADLGGIRTMLRAAREAEMALLTSERARLALKKHAIELISFREL